MRNFKDKECVVCDLVFKPTNSKAKYCLDCRVIGNKRQDGEYNNRPEVKARKLDHSQLPESKGRKREYEKERSQRPEIKADNLYRCRLRQANKLQATPAWFDKEEVKMIYRLARERGLQVDHMVPLQSDLVCGLHVQDNLRCIPAALNLHKGNKYWPGMSKEITA